MEDLFITFVCTVTAYALVKEWEEAVGLKRPDFFLRWLMTFFFALALVSLWAMVSRKG